MDRTSRQIEHRAATSVSRGCDTNPTIHGRHGMDTNDLPTFKTEQHAQTASQPVLHTIPLVMGRHSNQEEEEEEAEQLERKQEEDESEWRDAETVARLFKRKKFARETYGEFARALREIGAGCRVGEGFYVTAFISGIGDDFTGALLRLVRPKSLLSAVEEAARLRDTDGAHKAKRWRKTRHQRERARKRRTAEHAALAEEVVGEQLSPCCVGHGRTKRESSPTRMKREESPDPRQSAAVARKKSKRSRCFACEEPGHYARECPKRVRWQ